WLDGCVIPLAEARIPINDHGLLYGDGIFEGIRITAGRVFRLDDHLARFASAARAIGLTPPGGVAAARAAVLETARAFAQPEAYVRVVCTLGRFDLFACTEAFLTGSGAGLVPVRSLDGERLGGRGPVFNGIRAAFERAAPALGVPFQ